MAKPEQRSLIISEFKTWRSVPVLSVREGFAALLHACLKMRDVYPGEVITFRNRWEFSVDS